MGQFARALCGQMTLATLMQRVDFYKIKEVLDKIKKGITWEVMKYFNCEKPMETWTFDVDTMIKRMDFKDGWFTLGSAPRIGVQVPWQRLC